MPIFANDRDLLYLAVGGDEQAARQIIQMLSYHAYGLAYKMLANQADAEDVLQDAFIRLWKGAHLFSGQSKLSTYFYTIVSRVCLNKLKASPKNIFEEFDETSHPVEESIEFDLIEQQNKNDIQKALNSLTPKQRLAIVMWSQEGLTAQQIGEVLHMTKNGVDQLLHRAKAQLRIQLQKVVIMNNQDNLKNILNQIEVPKLTSRFEEQLFQDWNRTVSKSSDIKPMGSILVLVRRYQKLLYLLALMMVVGTVVNQNYFKDHHDLHHIDVLSELSLSTL